MSSPAQDPNQAVADDPVVKDILGRVRYEDAIIMAELPALRKINLKDNPKLHATPYRSDRRSYNEAAVGQIVGQDLEDRTCDHCARGNGRFEECVVVAQPDDIMFFGGACCNCRFGDHPERCSFYKGKKKGKTAKKSKAVKTGRIVKKVKAASKDNFGNHAVSGNEDSRILGWMNQIDEESGEEFDSQEMDGELGEASEEDGAKAGLVNTSNE